MAEDAIGSGRLDRRRLRPPRWRLPTVAPSAPTPRVGPLGDEAIAIKVLVRKMTRRHGYEWRRM